MWGNFWWIWTTFYSLQLIILKNLFINQRDKLLGFSFLQIFMVFERHWGIWRFWTQVHRVKVIIRACHLGHSGHLPDISYRYQVSVYASFMSSRYESSKFTSGQGISILWVCYPVQNDASRWSWTVFKWPFELHESNTEAKVGGLSSPNGKA